MLHFIKEMYPLDRRQLAQHVYTLLSSLRKTAIILQVSHTTVSRWLKYPERKAYDLKIQSKSKQVVQTIKAIIMNDPFVSVQRLKDIINSTLGLRPHATQGTLPPIKFNALFTIKNTKERFVNAEKAYLRVRRVGVA
jgi:predicted transcriptional regulator